MKKLRGFAHDLTPTVIIGREGLSSGIVGAVRAAIDDHELIKVRVLENSGLDRKEVGAKLAREADVHHVVTIGRMIVLYSRHPEHPTVPI